MVTQHLVSFESRVDVAVDGSGVVRAKAWKKDEANRRNGLWKCPHKNAHESVHPAFLVLASNARLHRQISVIPMIISRHEKPSIISLHPLLASFCCVGNSAGSPAEDWPRWGGPDPAGTLLSRKKIFLIASSPDGDVAGSANRAGEPTDVKWVV